MDKENKVHVMFQAFSGGRRTGTTETMTKWHKAEFRLKFWFVQIKSNIPPAPRVITVTV